MYRLKGWFSCGLLNVPLDLNKKLQSGNEENHDLKKQWMFLFKKDTLTMHFHHINGDGWINICRTSSASWYLQRANLDL